MPNSEVPRDSPLMWYEGQGRGQRGCHQCFRVAFMLGFIVITLLFGPPESSAATAASEYSLCEVKWQHGWKMPGVFCERSLEEI